MLLCYNKHGCIISYVYSTLNNLHLLFGLLFLERFGDGDTSGLDLDEVIYCYFCSYHFAIFLIAVVCYK